MEKVYITPNMAGAILEVDDSTIRRLIHRKKLPAKKICGRYLLDKEKVERFKIVYDKWQRD